MEKVVLMFQNPALHIQEPKKNVKILKVTINKIIAGIIQILLPIAEIENVLIYLDTLIKSVNLSYLLKLAFLIVFLMEFDVYYIHKNVLILKVQLIHVQNLLHQMVPVKPLTIH
jgi:hypothetical protein